MLVVVWDAMDAAIPRLQAEENLNAYNVAVVSSANAEEKSRQELLGLWREQASGAWRAIRRVEESMHSAFGRVIKALGPGHR